MNDQPQTDTSILSPSATWALQRLAEVRYGRNAPALGWSVTRELIGAGFVSHAIKGRTTSVSITAAGREFLKTLT